MTFFDLFRRKPREETRAAGMGFTSDPMAAREAYILGRSGVADLTATAQACVGLWEGGLGIADVDGTDLLNRRTMGLLGRSLALRGETVFLIREAGLILCNDWDVRTRNGIPKAYRVTISEAGGGNSETVLAAEVLHVRIGSDPAPPWHGTAPLRRARLTAGLLQSVETALAEVYDNAPLGSQIVPYPEGQETDMAALGRGFRGRRGQVLMRESVHVTAAGGPTPQTDWRPSDVTPDISKAMTKESLEAACDAVAAAFGVLPGMFYRAATGTQPISGETLKALTSALRTLVSSSPRSPHSFTSLPSITLARNSVRLRTH